MGPVTRLSFRVLDLWQRGSGVFSGSPKSAVAWMNFSFVILPSIFIWR
jgi:hypothetical protein